jgi:microsomal epoxide hydrolase
MFNIYVLSVNMISPTATQPDPAKLSALEKEKLEKVATWRKSSSAYAQEHGTRPATIGHVLSSNPLALLAW